MHRRISPLARFGLFVLLGLSSLRIPAHAAPPGQGKEGPANRLAKETSPYLLLHAHNPVDWYPWGPEAFAKAKAENKPIFLSVGYSSCYWCHVMERESFMDPEIAKALNDRFVCIKVDREERPDVDQVYMAAVQAMGPGGWPMSLFLTPDGRPFFGGTYFPPRERQGSAGFLTLVHEVAKAWAGQNAEINKGADALTEAVRRRLTASGRQRKLPLSCAMTEQGLAQLAEQFDPDYGGFGFNPQNSKRPKFPEPVNLVFLLDEHLRHAAGAASKPADVQAGRPKPSPTDPLPMVLLTLDRMARGGIRDHLGGGYHRYSTDRFWLVPHFEKMLYDNAQLASVHLLAFAITKDPRWRDEAEATFAFIERQMTSPDGAFYSALDAETRGEEGAYYVWTRDEVKAALGDGPDAEDFARVYGLSVEPNFEGGRHVLHQPKSLEEQAKALGTTPQELEARMAPLRARLLEARARRPAPLCDDKILTGWNGLMIAAYADGYRLLHVEKYRRAAETAVGFLLAKLRAPDGRLLRTYRAGQAKLPAYLEDYAFLSYGLLRLHAATRDPKWLREARTLTDRMLADFEDAQEGGFFFTAEGHESLLARPKDPFDNALPSGNSVAILDLLALDRETGDSSYLDHATKALNAFSTPLAQNPVGLPLMLVGLEQYLGSRPAQITPKPLFAGALDEVPNKPVTASARLAGEPGASLAPGREFDAVVTVTIRDGWHIYANPSGVPEFKPTTLRIDPASGGLATLIKVTYPAGKAQVLESLGKEKIALYEGEVQFTARLRLAEDAKPDSIPLKFKISYQACNDRLCLAPANLEIPLEVSVGR